MKSNKPDLNRSRRSGRGSSVTERRSRTLEISIQRLETPTQSSIRRQAAAKLADPAQVQMRSKRLTGLPKARQAANISLPPISRSRSVSGKAERGPAHRKDGAHLPTGDVTTGSAVLHVMVTRCRKVNQELNRYCKISAANKAAVQDSETSSRLIKETFDGQPAATLTPAAVDAPARQKKNDVSDPSSTMMPVTVKHDASLRQQRDFCSDDSAIETESEGSGDKGRPKRLAEVGDDEYYSKQRITDWVLKVNASLFETGSDELKSSKPAEEQDMATIKIIYSGD